MKWQKHVLVAVTLAIPLLISAAAQAQQQPSRPNIVVIWGDDIGFWNVSAYSRGAMGYRTPNIDRMAKEGAIFTDH
jgi:arylsulfatase A-like enzyme